MKSNDSLTLNLVLTYKKYSFNPSFSQGRIRVTLGDHLVFGTNEILLLHRPTGTRIKQYPLTKE